MKEIFDWLREQIENKCNYEPIDYDYCDMACSGEQGFIAREDALSAINEAEAKWKEDCCVYEDTESLREKGIEYDNDGLYKPSCIDDEDDFFNWNEIRHFKFCPYCGKRIKISEVE